MTNITMKEFLAMNEHDRLKFGIVYRRHYEEACEFAGVENPTPWEDLTHEQRMSVRDECIRYTIELNDSMKELLRGKETQNQG